MVHAPRTNKIDKNKEEIECLISCQTVVFLSKNESSTRLRSHAGHILLPPWYLRIMGLVLQRGILQILHCIKAGYHVLDNGGARSPLCSLPAVQCKRLLVKPGSHKQVKMMSWKNNAGICGSFDSFSTQFTLSKFLLSMSTRI